MALNDDEAFVPPPTVFVDDRDVLAPSTSNPTFDDPPPLYAAAADSNTLINPATTAAHALVADGTRMFQPIATEAYVNEVYGRKQHKVVNGYCFGPILGEGSYSKVKEVVDTRTLQRKSIKIIKVQTFIRAVFSVLSCRTNV